MTDRDPLGDALETLEPPFADEPVDWDDVLRRAAGESARAPRRRPRRLAFAAVATAVAACVALVVSPFGGDRAGVVDRALAAIGDGPVLHVVTRSPGMGGTLVDLQSGERTQLRIEQETWFDPDRGFRATIRLGASVLEEYSAPVDRPVRMRFASRGMEVFSRDYRDALREGRARVLRKGDVAGTPVYWLRVVVDSPAPPLPGCAGRACQDVAVSRETYEPVYLRFGPPRRGFGQRVLELESLPAGSGDIPRRATSMTAPGFVPLPRRPVDRAGAGRLLRTPLAWPGRTVAGLPLTRMEAGGDREFLFTPSMRRPRYRAPNRVVTLVFGQPRRLVINEAHRATYSLLRGPSVPGATPFGVPAGYVPPRGSAFVARGGRQAILRLGKLVIGVVGSRPDEVRAALRELSPAR